MKKFSIAVFEGDGIGKEITRPSAGLLSEAAKAHGFSLDLEYYEGGAELYKKSGDALPEENFNAAKKADAIYFAAMGLPGVRYPDGTEIGPQHDFRKRLGLYAGVRPCLTMPGLPLPLKDGRGNELDFVIVRESTEGIFAFPRKSEKDGEEAAYNLIKISKEVSEKLFDYSFRLAARRKEQGGKGKVTCIDKANVLSSMAFFREIFTRLSKNYPKVEAGCMYVDAAALHMVKDPWAFDVCPTENLCGDILSDLAAALMGGLGMTASAEIGDNNGLFQPCHGTAPDIAGTGRANPTGMLLSGAMMLEYLGDRFGVKEAYAAAGDINKAIKSAYSKGTLLPYEMGGNAGLKEIINAVSAELCRL